MTLPVTAITAAFVALMLLLTAIDTVRQRWRARAAFGDAGGDQRLISAIRSHGNLAEHGPIAILLIGLLELTNVNHWALTIVAGAFLVARAFHILGLYMPMKKGPPIPRTIGVLGTWITLGLLIAWTFWNIATVNF